MGIIYVNEYCRDSLLIVLLSRVTAAPISFKTNQSAIAGTSRFGTYC